MPTTLTILITKEVIAQSKNCGRDNEEHQIGNNCAIATALVPIFPEVYVNGYCIFPWGIDTGKNQRLQIPLPPVAQQFIKLFDGFRLTPRLRLLLPAFEFTINIPDEVIEQINIDDVREWMTGIKENPLFVTREQIPAYDSFR